MKTLLLSVSALLILSGCARLTTHADFVATEAALCDVWQDSLPTRSQRDTAQTIAEIGRAYDVFEAVCQRPAFAD